MKVLIAWAVFTALFFGARPAAEYLRSKSPEQVQVDLTQRDVPVICRPQPNGLVMCVPDTSQMKPMTSAAPASLPWPPMSIFFWPVGLLAIYAAVGIHAVKEWERVPVLRFGKYADTIGPGLAFVDPLFSVTQKAIGLPLSVREFTVASIQSHDNVPVKFVLVLTTKVTPDRIRDYFLASYDTKNAVMKKAIAACAANVSNTELDGILHEHGELSARITADLSKSVGDWGITVLAVELRDISIADEKISEAIAMKARASKEGDAEIVRAHKQEQVATALSAAAKGLTPEGWRLKELEVLLEMTRSAENNTVIPARALNALSIAV